MQYSALSDILVDTGRKLNVQKTFRRRPVRLLNVLCTFNLRPVSTGILYYKQSCCKDFQFKRFPVLMKDSFRESIGVVKL